MPTKKDTPKKKTAKADSERQPYAYSRSSTGPKINHLPRR